MTLRELLFEVNFKGDMSAVQRMDRATTRLKGGAASAIANLERVGTTMTRVGRTATIGMSLPLAAAGYKMTQTIAGFSDQMLKVQAVTQASGDEFDQLRGLAEEMGKQTRFSAMEAAGGMEFLARAGFDTNEIMAALPVTLAGAAANSVDLATTADIVSNALSAFGMDARNTDVVMDTLTTTAQNANVDLLMLGESMNLAGAMAASSNQSIQETATIIGLLGDAGIQGSRAGTTFNAVLRDIRKSSEDGAIAIADSSVAVYDAAGNMRNLGDIVYEVSDALQGLRQDQRDQILSTVFQEESLRGINVLLQANRERYDEVSDAVEGSAGSTQKAADIMESGIGGALRTMKSRVEGAVISMEGSLVPAIEKVTDKITGAADWFINLDDNTKDLIVRMAGLAIVLPPVIWAAGKVVGVFVAASKVLLAVKGVMAAVTGGSALMGGGLAAVAGGPVGLLAAGLIALVGVGALVYANWDKITSAGEAMWSYFSDRMGYHAENIRNFFTMDLYNIGQNVVQSFINGFNSLKNKLMGNAEDLAKRTESGVTGQLDIKSPSKVMVEHGKDVTRGLAIGMSRESGDLSLASSNSKERIVEPLRRGGGNVVNSSPTITINITDSNNPRETAREVEKIVKNAWEREAKKMAMRVGVYG